MAAEIKSLRGYSVKAKANKEAEIYLYEEIGGYWGGVTAKQFAKDVKDLGDVEKISLRLNSPGGEVFEGITIYNVLKQHKASVTVNIDGLAASIASVVAMAGDEIRMADNAMMMIHPAWGWAAGNAEEMRKTADMLEKLDGTIVTTYQSQTTLDEAKIKSLMAAETWMNAKEALDYGFVDSITEALEVAACFDLSKFKYRNAPEGASAPKGESRFQLARMSLAAQRIRTASGPK